MTGVGELEIASSPTRVWLNMDSITLTAVGIVFWQAERDPRMGFALHQPRQHDLLSEGQNESLALVLTLIIHY